jgi:ABC-type branched-subunit amino acid transport system ATPase component/branched-subunit amino acid ABC-type transport system permease component
MDFLRFVILGLAGGAVTAILAQTLVITYRASGIINLSQSAFLMVGAYAYYQFNQWNWPLPLAVIVSVILSGALGAIVFHLVIKPLEHSAPLTRMVATLGVLIVVQAAITLVYSVNVHAEPSWLPTHQIRLPGGEAVGIDRILILGIGVLCAVVLSFIYRRTSFGRLSSAVAENPLIVSSLGYSPNRVAVLNWALGAALAGFAGTLIGPILYLVPSALALLIVSALAAAVIGGFRSFPVAFAASLSIGVIQSLLERYANQPGVSDAVPFLIVTAWLIFRGRAIPLRSHVLDRLPAVGTGRIRAIPLSIVVAGVYCLIFFGLSQTLAAAFTFTLAAALICISMVVITGFAGQLSLAQYVLAGCGAFLAVQLTDYMPVLLAVAGAVLGTAVLGAVIAIPSVRTRGMTLAVVTLALASVLYDALLNNSGANGGAAGLSAPTPPTIFGWSIDPVIYPQRYAAVALTAVVIVGLMVANLRRGMIGRRLLAVRSNERAASALGISVPVSKVYAFALAAGIAALAGALIAYQQSVVLTTEFDPYTSMVFAGMAVAGGVGMVGGALVGATMISGGIISQLLGEYVGSVNSYVPLVGGLLLLLSLRSAPDGIFEDLRSKSAAVTARLRRKLAGTRPQLPDPANSAQSPDTTQVHAPLNATSKRLSAENNSPALQVTDLSVNFGGVVALEQISLEIVPGQVHGLIGPNGAGKTTLVDTISGFVANAAGTVAVGTQLIDRTPPHRRARKGVIRSFQSIDLFDDLSIRENIAVASDRVRRWRYVTDLFWPARARLTPEALEAIQICRLEPYLDLKPRQLPFGRRRLVGIARALASSPSVLLLDEPAAGLGDAEAAEVGELIRAVADRGVAVLLIEHRVDLIAAHSDIVTVLQSGQHLASGIPGEVLSREDVLAAYLGTAPTTAPEPEPQTRP